MSVAAKEQPNRLFMHHFIFSGKRIGYKRIIFAGRSSAKDLKLPPCDAGRLRIDNSLACPLINNFQIIGTER